MPEALFVGRERETDLYKKFLLRETPWALIIIGLGGIGKSTLLHRLAEYTLAESTLSKTRVVILDFADEELRNDPLKLLEKLTNDTANYCDLQQIDDDFKNTLQQNFDQLAQLSSERAQTGVSETGDPALREIRHQMRELAAEGFYAQIKTFKLDRLVVMLDTCEWLSEPEGVEIGQWVLNERHGQPCAAQVRCHQCTGPEAPYSIHARQGRGRPVPGAHGNGGPGPAPARLRGYPWSCPLCFNHRRLLEKPSRASAAIYHCRPT